MSQKNSHSFNTRTRSSAKSGKHGVLAEMTAVATQFSTLFFTHLLKTQPSIGNIFAVASVSHRKTQGRLIHWGKILRSLKGHMSKSSSPSVVLTSRKLKQIYATMLHCRMIEDRARLLFPDPGFSKDQFIGNGLEAVEVGAALGLRRRDCIGPWGRHFIFSFLKRQPLTSSFQRFFALADSPEEMSATKAARAAVAAGVGLAGKNQIGRASCRERVEISVVAV